MPHVLLPLQPDQVTAIQGYVSSGDYADGYNYVSGLLADANVNNDPAMTDAGRWFDIASQINGDSGFFGSFARGYLESEADANGVTVTDSDFQNASNTLAKQVLTEIVDQGGIPDAQTIVPQDVANMESDLGLPNSAWPGGLLDWVLLGGNYASFVDDDGNPVQTTANFVNAMNGVAAGIARAIKDGFPAPGDLFPSLFGPNGPFKNLNSGSIPFPTGSPLIGGMYLPGISAAFNSSMVDPIVLDLGGTGVQLVSLQNSQAYFDLYNTGFAVHTGWVGPQTGILVEDKNGDGSINNITELFGSASTDGFAALDALDANHDGVINALDPRFANLEVWTDTNGNGVTDPGELHTLANLGITSINLSTQSVSHASGGNLIAEIATYTRADGTSGEIAEAYFDNSQLDSQFTGSYQLNPTVLTLPNLRGYGTLPDLFVSMSLDPTLLQMVQSFSVKTLADGASFASDVRSILYQWAGVEDVDPASRGQYVNAQELGVLEKFTGESFTESEFGLSNNPTNDHQGATLDLGFQQLLSATESRLLLQGPLAPFLSGASFDYDTDSLIGTADLAALVKGFGNAMPSDQRQAQLFWLGVAPLIDQLAAGLGLPQSEYEGALESSFAAANLPFSLSSARTQSVLLGDAGSDTFTPSFYSHSSYYFDGEGGGDFEQGVGGSDTFVFNAGYGHLEISEGYSGLAQPVLQLGAGISAASLTVKATSNGTGLVLTDGVSGDQITLDSMLGVLSSGVQRVQFADGTTLSAAQLRQMETTGTSGNDVLYGSEGADLIDGKGGNDFEAGDGGSDTFVFNAGYGHLEIDEGYSGTDQPVLQLGAGISAASLTVKATSNGTGLVLTDGVSGDQITLDSMLGVLSSGVQRVQFADGTTLSAAQLRQMETTGTSGNDVLYGSEGADLIDGKGGNDFEAGDGGSDTFVFNAGYGHLEIDEGYSGTDQPVLQLGAGISAASLTVKATSNGTGLVLTDGVSGDQITLDSMLGVLSSGVQRVQFADGTTLSAAQLRQMETTGTSGNDVLYGSEGADLIDGKGGNDFEAGDGGSDTFVFNAGYGHLEIDEGYSGTDQPVLQLGAGISAASLTVKATSNGTGLVLTDGVSGDQITLDSMLVNSQYGVQQIQFADGTTFSAAQLVAMARSIVGTTGNDALTGTPGADLFDGKGGNDVEVGDGGNDTFVFNAGYGHLEINEVDFSATRDNVLQLGAGISESSVSVSSTSDGSGLVLTDGVSGDQITLDGMLSSRYGVQQVQFADGAVWTSQQLIRLATTGTAGNDVLRGSPDADVFDGKGGNDVEVGDGGNDTFVFNAGYGHLEINEVDFSATRDNVLQLGAGISESSVSVSSTSDGSGLVLTDGVSGDQITLDGMLSSRYGVQQVQFADGAVWTSQQLIRLATTGTAGNDVLRGSPDADVFDGKGGNDVEVGNGGSDTYVLQPGYGSLTIANGISSSNAAAGNLSIQDANPNDIWLQRVGNNLQVDLMGSTTEATIQNWFSNTYSQIGKFTVSGGSAGNLAVDAQINQLIQAMATFSGNNPGFDPTSTANQTITDPTVLAAVNTAWHQ